jgi:hypothetical protein
LMFIKLLSFLMVLPVQAETVASRHTGR